MATHQIQPGSYTQVFKVRGQLQKLHQIIVDLVHIQVEEEEDNNPLNINNTERFYSAEEQKEELNETLTTINQLVEELKLQYEEKVIDKVVELVVKYKNCLERAIELSKALKQNQSAIDTIINANAQFLTMIEWVWAQVTQCAQIIEMKDGWQTERTKEGFEMTYRKLENSPLVTIKIASTIEVNLLHFLALIYELDLYKNWFPFVVESKNLKLVDKSTKVGYMKLDIPFIPMRESYVYGLGVDRITKNGTVMIVSRTIDTDKNIQRELGVEIPETSPIERMQIPFFTFQLKALSREKLEVVLIGNFDGKVKFVPDWIINAIVRKFCYFMFERIVKKTKDFKNSIWQQRMEQNRAFYSWIEAKFEEYKI